MTVDQHLGFADFEELEHKYVMQTLSLIHI